MTVIKITNHLRYYRERHALTQKELAKKAGLAKNTVYRIEKGTRIPRLKTRKKLAEILQIEVYKLFQPIKYRS